VIGDTRGASSVKGAAAHGTSTTSTTSTLSLEIDLAAPDFLPALLAGIVELRPKGVDVLAVRPAGAPSCTVVVRGGSEGIVEDAEIRESFPAGNFGDESDANVGTYGNGESQMLLRFSTSVPAGAKIVSATARMPQHNTDATATVRVHKITASWSEADITWATFVGAYDAKNTIASFTIGSGPASFDLTAQMRAWVSGAEENDGVLLEQGAGATTTFRTSEHVTNDRPKLSVCYTVPLAPPPGGDPDPMEVPR